MKSHLKVKVVSLSSEMTYIRRQEEKWKNKARYNRLKQKQEPTSSRGYHLHQKYAEDNFWSLRLHRDGLKYDVRHTHLAYGALNGVPYSKMEFICYGVFKGMGSYEPDWTQIASIVERFSKDEPNAQEIMQRFAEWIEDAKKWYEGNKERIPLMQNQLAADRIKRANDDNYQFERVRRAHEHRKLNGLT